MGLILHEANQRQRRRASRRGGRLIALRKPLIRGGYALSADDQTAPLTPGAKVNKALETLRRLGLGRLSLPKVLSTSLKRSLVFNAVSILEMSGSLDDFDEAGRATLLKARQTAGMLVSDAILDDAFARRRGGVGSGKARTDVMAERDKLIAKLFAEMRPSRSSDADTVEEMLVPLEKQGYGINLLPAARQMIRIAKRAR